MAKGGGSANKSYLYQETKALLNEAARIAKDFAGQGAGMARSGSSVLNTGTLANVPDLALGVVVSSATAAALKRGTWRACTSASRRAAAWLGKTVRQVREYATGAREQLKQEMGPEFESLRKPLEDLRELRNFNPKQAVAKHLFEDPDDLASHGLRIPVRLWRSCRYGSGGRIRLRSA